MPALAYIGYHHITHTMKHTIYKLLFIFCLVAGTSCSQNSPDGMEESTEPATTETADTTAATDEVPASLQQH